MLDPFDEAVTDIGAAAKLAQRATWALAAVTEPPKDALAQLHVTVLELEACALQCRDRIRALRGPLPTGPAQLSARVMDRIRPTASRKDPHDALDAATGESRR